VRCDGKGMRECKASTRWLDGQRWQWAVVAEGNFGGVDAGRQPQDLKGGARVGGVDAAGMAAVHDVGAASSTTCGPDSHAVFLLPLPVATALPATMYGAR
jgi:hypothetical protein